MASRGTIERRIADEYWEDVRAQRSADHFYEWEVEGFTPEVVAAQMETGFQMLEGTYVAPGDFSVDEQLSAMEFTEIFKDELDHGTDFDTAVGVNDGYMTPWYEREAREQIEGLHGDKESTSNEDHIAPSVSLSGLRYRISKRDEEAHLAQQVKVAKFAARKGNGFKQVVEIDQPVEERYIYELEPQQLVEELRAKLEVAIANVWISPTSITEGPLIDLAKELQDIAVVRADLSYALKRLGSDLSNAAVGLSLNALEGVDPGEEDYVNAELERVKDIYEEVFAEILRINKIDIAVQPHDESEQELLELPIRPDEFTADMREGFKDRLKQLIEAYNDPYLRRDKAALEEILDKLNQLSFVDAPLEDYQELIREFNEREYHDFDNEQPEIEEELHKSQIKKRAAYKELEGLARVMPLAGPGMFDGNALKTVSGKYILNEAQQRYADMYLAVYGQPIEIRPFVSTSKMLKLRGQGLSLHQIYASSRRHWSRRRSKNPDIPAKTEKNNDKRVKRRSVASRNSSNPDIRTGSSMNSGRVYTPAPQPPTQAQRRAVRGSTNHQDSMPIAIGGAPAKLGPFRNNR